MKQRDVLGLLGVGVVCMLALLLSAPSVADDCKPIQAQSDWNQRVEFEPCERLGVEMEWCKAFPVQGNLNATWRQYSPWGNGDYVIRSCDGWTPEDTNGVYDDAVASESYVHFLSTGVSANWTFDDFETPHGELWTTGAWVQNQGTWGSGQDIYGGILSVTGGTGKYAGATGFLGITHSIYGIYIHGRICTVSDDD